MVMMMMMMMMMIILFSLHISCLVDPDFLCISSTEFFLMIGYVLHSVVVHKIDRKFPLWILSTDRK